MRKWLNKYFDFSKREYNGLLVMIFILAVIFAIPAIYEFFVPEDNDLRAEEAAIRKLLLIEGAKKETFHYKYERKESHHATSKPFPFDPNHTSAADWQLLGLSPKQAAVMIRYTDKGGKFRKKEDVQKMYPISAGMYERLSPYIHIDTKDTITFKKKYAKITYPVRKPIMVSLNTADTIALDAIKGIGPAFARRIVKYRERLGGFYKKEQLLEVFGLDSTKYDEIKDQIDFNGGALKMININKVEFIDLKGNPYLNFKQINAIIQFRKQHGNYGNIADLKKVAILSAETVEKLAPYISFDHD